MAIIMARKRRTRSELEYLVADDGSDVVVVVVVGLLIVYSLDAVLPGPVDAETGVDASVCVGTEVDIVDVLLSDVVVGTLVEGVGDVEVVVCHVIVDELAEGVIVGNTPVGGEGQF